MVDSQNEWTQMPLEDCMEAIIDYRGKTPKKTSAGIPLVTAKIIKRGRIEEPAEFIAPSDYDDWMRRGIPEPGDVVLTTEAPLGEVAQLDERKIALAQRVITLRGKEHLLDNTFLKYLLISEPIQDKLKARASGTTVLGIKQSELRKVTLSFPPLPEQRAIASILGALDDKIELNRRMNATLESLARAIFKSWFVDFDPVKINAGQMPADSYDPTLLSLFPSTFQDSELGPIPEGWNVEPVGKHVVIKHGYAFKGEFFSKEPRRDVLLTPGNFAIGGGFKGDKLKYYEGPVEEEYILLPGDLLVTMTDLSKAGDTLGYPAFVPESLKYRYLHNQRLGRVFINDDSPVGAAFIHESFRTSRYRSHVLGTASGSTVKHSSPTRIRDHEIAVGTPEVHALFEERVSPLVEAITRNDRVSMRLGAIRDRLLPELLSGRLVVMNSKGTPEQLIA
ncbi:restriction endonuclease subunit S [Stieleria varia]|uniref:EcoKI restriction-modification system protein HsdS n=1 Tax=Stieleria varia TaxID=2528005 RepID=A0A5C6AS97_9BACT|nr:restriction endonuclease subunit S [Stieleria varia]TWU02865.1 EcoKI restriction-modification system protein HsdS [Stieleria varia]